MNRSFYIRTTVIGRGNLKVHRHQYGDTKATTLRPVCVCKCFSICLSGSAKTPSAFFEVLCVIGDLATCSAFEIHVASHFSSTGRCHCTFSENCSSLELVCRGFSSYGFDIFYLLNCGRVWELRPKITNSLSGKIKFILTFVGVADFVNLALPCWSVGAQAKLSCSSSRCPMERLRDRHETFWTSTSKTEASPIKQPASSPMEDAAES